MLGSLGTIDSWQACTLSKWVTVLWLLTAGCTQAQYHRIFWFFFSFFGSSDFLRETRHLDFSCEISWFLNIGHDFKYFQTTLQIKSDRGLCWGLWAARFGPVVEGCVFWARHGDGGGVSLSSCSGCLLHRVRQSLGGAVLHLPPLTLL